MHQNLCICMLLASLSSFILHILIYVSRFIHTTNDEIVGQEEGEEDEEGMYM
jgi:hypothetical protein